MASSRSRVLIRDTVIILLVVAGLFGAIEGAVRMFWPQTIETEYLGGASIAVPDPELVHRLRPHARSRSVGPEFAVSYQISEQGLRDHVVHTLPKPAGTIRILALGDSFTYGTGSDYDTVWPTVFERAMQADGYSVEVVKAGVPDYDTRREALYLERIFSAYDPDIVLLTFLSNDLFTNTPIEVMPQPHLIPTKGFGAKTADLHSLILAKRILMTNDWLYARLYGLTKRREYFVTPPTPTLQRQIEVTKTLLERAHGFCRRNGCELVVMSIPQQFQVLLPDRGEALGVDIGLVDETFSAFAAQQGFPWLETLPTLRKAYHADREDLYYRFDGHLNERGNRAVADFLKAAFVERFADRLQRPLPTPAGTV